MKKYFESSNIILVATVIVCIGTIFSLFSTFSDSSFRTFFCSDTLYLPSIYKDIFIDHNSLKGWHLNPAPSIFPDMVVYFSLMSLTSNFIITSFLFAVIQYLFFIYLIFRLIKAIGIPDPKLIASLSNLLLLLFFMVSFYSKDFNITFYLVSNAYHNGTFLMALLSIILSIEYLKYKKNATLGYLAVISVFSVFSDRLFIVLYSIPWLIFMLFYFKAIDKRKLIRITFIDILAVIVGIIAFNLLSNSKYVYVDQPHRIMEYKYFGECLKLLFSQIYGYLVEWNVKSLIIIISLLTFISMMVTSIKKIVGPKQLDIKDTYYILSIIFSVIVLFAPVINGNYTGYDTFRYNIHVFYLLIINSGIVIYFIIQRSFAKSTKILSGLIVIIVIGALVNILIQFNSKGFVSYFNYYPKNVESVDTISTKEKLYCGLGDYWTAKVVTMFSKNGVRVYSALNTIDPYCHVMNENWYLKGRFNFVISDDEKQDSVLNCLFKNVRVVRNDNIKLIVTPEFEYNSDFKKVDYKMKP